MMRNGIAFTRYVNMMDLHIGKLTIGERSPTVIVAEIAYSHNGSIETAKKMVDEVKAAGADVAKFQIHLPDVEMVPGSVQMWDGSLHDILLRYHFTPEMHKEMMDYCEKVGVEYLCTPFCPAAVDILNDLGVKAFKTGSGELTNLPHHRKLARISAQTGKPVIVSTGMSRWEEIAETVSVYAEEGAKENLMLTNCTSEYPPNDYRRLNLGRIRRMQEDFGVHVGHSDHTMDNYSAFVAVAMGARLIEKHFTLSRAQVGPDHKISLEPQMLKDLVEGIRKVEVALGSEKSISSDEQIVRDWAFHSVVADRDIPAGAPITLENVRPARPGRGIPAKYLDKNFSAALLGKAAKRDLPRNTIVQWDDIVGGESA